MYLNCLYLPERGLCDVRGAVMAGVVMVLLVMLCDEEPVVPSKAEGGVMSCDVKGRFSPPTLVSGCCVRWCLFRLTTSPTRATNRWSRDNWATEETGGRVIAPLMGSDVFVGSLVAGAVCWLALDRPRLRRKGILTN